MSDMNWGYPNDDRISMTDHLFIELTIKCSICGKDNYHVMNDVILCPNCGKYFFPLDHKAMENWMKLKK